MARHPGRSAGARVSVATAVARRVPAVVLCALATHAAVYRSLWPRGEDHGYLVWYTPLVGCLSGLALVVVPLLLAFAVARRRADEPVPAVGVLTGGAGARDPVAEATILATTAFIFLFGQESLESSLELHRVAPATFSPSTWVVLLVAVVSVSAGVAWLGRAVSTLVEGILRRAPASQARTDDANRVPRSRRVTTRRSHPLAVHGGRRAPPSRLMA